MKQFLMGALVIAWTTVLEAIRNRLLLVAMTFVIVLVALSVVAGSVSLGERGRLIIDIGLFASSAIGSIIAAALTITSFAGELSKHTAYILLVRPLPRWAFVLGKFLGVYLTMIIITSFMLLSTAAILYVYGENIPIALIASMWMSYVEMGLVISVALLFGTLAVPALAASYTTGVIIAGHLANDIKELASNLWHDNFLASRILYGLYFVVPDLQQLSLRSQAANNMSIPKGVLLYGTQYGLAYTLMMLFLAMLIFSWRKVL